MGISPKVKTLIERYGYKSVHAFELEMFRTPDEEIIEYARKNQSIVVTTDSDFAQIVMLNQIYDTTIITLRLQNPSAQDQMNALGLLFDKVKLDQVMPSLITIEKNRHRIRRLI